MNHSYFKQLRQQMEGNPYQERFLQELHQHAEDLNEDQPNKKTLTPSDMKQHFGEPKEVKKTFINITRPFHRFFASMQALMYGMIILPLFYLLMLFGFILRGSFPNFLQKPMGDLIPLFIISLLIPLIWFFTYKHIFKKYHQLRSITDLPKWFWLALLFLPTCCFFLFFYTKPSGMVSFAYFFITIASNTVVALWAVYSANPARKKKVKDPVINAKWLAKWKSRLGILLAIYLVCVSLLRLFIAVGYPNNYSTLQDKVLFALFFPFRVLEVVVFGGLYESVNITSLTSTYFFWFTGTLLILAGVISIFYMLINKRWSLVLILVACYSFSSLLIPGRFFEHSFNFKAPVYSISTALEKSQMGPFYGWSKYSLNIIQGGYYYHLSKESSLKDLDTENGDLFVIWRNINGALSTAFSLDPDQWPSAGVKGLKIVSYENPFKNYFLPLEKLPEHFTCHNKALGGLISEDFPQDYCDSLLFKGEVILDQNGKEFNILNAELSDDGNWFLISLYNLGSPVSVYLLDLSSLQNNI